jgi:hypothetical protein
MDESQARPRPLCKMAKAGMTLFFDRVKVFEHVNGVYEMYRILLLLLLLAFVSGGTPDMRRMARRTERDILIFFTNMSIVNFTLFGSDICLDLHTGCWSGKGGGAIDFWTSEPVAE